MDSGGQEVIYERPSWSSGQDDKTWTTIQNNGDAPPEAASGGKSKMPHEMHTTRLGVKVLPDQNFDEIWRILSRGSNPGFYSNKPTYNQ